MKKSILLLVTCCFSVLTPIHAALDFKQVQKVVASDRGLNDYFGSCVAISGDYAVVGTPGDCHNVVGSDSLNRAGAVYIYKRNVGTGAWSLIQKIVASDRAAADYFGYKVGISGNYIIVGDNGEAEDANGLNTLSGAGSAYVFKLNTSTGLWAQQQKIVASDRAISDCFGQNVAISGDYIIVGVEFESHDANGSNTMSSAGSAYIFKRDATSDTWSQQQKIVASDRFSMEWFGSSVGICGDYAVVGAQNDGIYQGMGSAYVFKRNTTTGIWAQQQKIVASDQTTGYASPDYFGSCVAITDGYIIIGADDEDLDVSGGNSLSSAGAAYIYKLNTTTGTWAQQQKIVPSDRAASDFFGTSVSISGEYALVGAPGEDEDANGTNTLSSAGSVYVFKLNTGTNTWSQLQKIVSSDRAVSDVFGFSVAVSGNYTFVGAKYEKEDASGAHTITGAGSAYIFNLTSLVGLKDNVVDTNGLTLYPNPVSEGFQVIGIKEDAKLSITDISGKMVLTKNITSNEYINVNTLPQGLYIVKISTLNDTFVQRIIKK